MKNFTLGILLVPSMVVAMEHKAEEKQKANALFHLKQVLVAGRYCYGHHIAIHTDAKQRAKDIVLVCKKNAARASGLGDRALLAKKLSSWQQLLGGVIEVYHKQATPIEPYLDEALHGAHHALGQWIEVFKSNQEIDAATWKSLEDAFCQKVAYAESHKTKAMIAQDEFERNINIDTKLALEPAVYAWCLILK